MGHLLRLYVKSILSVSFRELGKAQKFAENAVIQSCNLCLQFGQGRSLPCMGHKHRADYYGAVMAQCGSRVGLLD